MGCPRKMSILLVVAVAVVATATVAEAQIPSCGQKLISCGSYLNSTTKPPDSCCNPLEEAMTKELSCLCDLFNDASLIKSLNINVTQALALPALCGIPGNLVTACPGPTSSPTPQPGTPPKNNVGRTASTGIFGLLVIWISIQLC